MSLFRQAVFCRSVYDLKELPDDDAAEIAFAGRSNAGKSSAINALADHKRLAFVSKTPGRTQTINFFSLGPHRYLSTCLVTATPLFLPKKNATGVS